MKRFAVIGRQPWNHRDFLWAKAHAHGQWVFASSNDDLAQLSETASEFRYLFFLHWSDRVPAELTEMSECVCFHMTDVPFGRGGSPLQNLIMQGHRNTVLTALKMTSDFDAGPVYAKEPMSLEGGTAEEIYQRASRLSVQMAVRIAEEEPEPVPQSGDVVIFKRRTPAQSRLDKNVSTLEGVYDHIRMLDAEGYPPAYVELGQFRFEFGRAALYHDGVHADVRIRLLSDTDSE